MSTYHEQQQYGTDPYQQEQQHQNMPYDRHDSQEMQQQQQQPYYEESGDGYNMAGNDYGMDDGLGEHGEQGPMFAEMNSEPSGLPNNSNGNDGGLSSSGQGIDFDDPKISSLPRILLMGPRRSGKTSIQRVVFNKMSPHETLFRLEATQQLERTLINHTSLCKFTIWDFPGDYYGSGRGYGSGMMGNYPVVANRASGTFDDYNQQPGGDDEDPESAAAALAQAEYNDDLYIYARSTTALIYVIDAQDEPYDHVLQNFTETVSRAVRANPHIAIEVFINKVDGELFLSDEAKYDCRRDVMQQVSDELSDAGIFDTVCDNVPIAYHLTSIYDHSIYEAFSRVVQKLIPQLPTLENLLNVLVGTCAMEKAYLFDVASKLYIGTDSSPVDMQSVELCSDMIDVVLDVSGIYGMKQPPPQMEQDEDLENDTGDYNLGMGERRISSPMSNASSLSETNEQKMEGNYHIDDVPDMEHHPSEDDDQADQLFNTGDMYGMQTMDNVDEREEQEDELLPPDESAYDSESSSTIRLSNGMVLYLKEVDTMLALVCLTQSNNFRKKSLINYNIDCLKKALRNLVVATPPSAATK